jgi:hypothetical protein
MLGCSGATRTPLMDAGVGELEVAPLSLGFGAVTVGSQVVQTLTATNTGSGPLTVTLSVTGDAQALYAVAPTGPLALVAGDALSIIVTYTPSGPSSADSASLVLSWGTSGSIDVPLTGSGLAPPCNYTITPTSLAFGEVKPGTSQVSSFTIEDTGSTDCWITDLTLGADTEAAFSLPEGPLASQRLSAPGSNEPFPSSLLVNVAFAPLQTGTYSGSVQFVISDPGAPDQVVQLSGAGANSCFLMQPAELDFGNTVGISNGQFCGNGKKRFVAFNGCTKEVQITSMNLTGGTPFSFDPGSLPVSVAPGMTSAPFTVGFMPTMAGTYNGGIQVQTDEQNEPYGVGLAGGAVAPPAQTDAFTFTGVDSFVLSSTPLASTLEVVLNGTTLTPNQWTYDGTANSVTIDSSITLSNGDQVLISYSLVCE